MNITLPHTITGRGGESSASASASASAWSRVCLLLASLGFADAYSVVAWRDVTCVCVCVCDAVAYRHDTDEHAVRVLEELLFRYIRPLVFFCSPVRLV